MRTVKGKIKIENMYEGSKSEGMVALLTTDEGNIYTLYRAGKMPQNDKFFATVNNAEVKVTGSVEEGNNYICVESMTLADGTTLTAKEEPMQSPSIIFTDNSNEIPVTVKSKNKGKLPRKLKKQLKKQLKNNKQ